MTSLSNRQDRRDLRVSLIDTGAAAKSRRLSLLASTAFAGGVFALALTANPQSAAAACFVTALPNTVECSVIVNPTTTTDTTNTNAALIFSNDRQQLFNNGGVVNPGVLTQNTIDSGSTVNGFGLAITTTTATDVNVNNAGTVTLTSGIPSAGGSAAFDIQSAGGNITYAGNGAVNDGGQGTVALHLQTSGNGSILVGAPLNPITTTISGTTGIFAQTVNGGQNIFLNGGSITATGAFNGLGSGAGIFGTASGSTGSVSIITTGNTTIAASGPAVGSAVGILINVAGGTSFISSDANIGSTTNPFLNGISALNFGFGNGPITIDQTGGTIYATSIGVNGHSEGGSGGVSITTGATSTIAMVGSGPSDGIRALVDGTGTGGVNVVSAGVIDPPTIGIDAEIQNANNASNVNVSVPSGSVTATNIGILASTTGTGGVNVTTVAGTAVTENTATGAGNGGIIAKSTSGTISVNAGDKVTAVSDAIFATTTNGGSINITTGAGAITGDSATGASGAGIVAHATTAGSGNIVIQTGSGLVSGIAPANGSGGTGVIDASTINNGTIAITVGSGGVLAGVTGGRPDGVAARSVNGNISITTNGLVDTSTNNDGDGINANASGSGSVSVTANANVKAAEIGINATTAGAGSVNVVTNGNVSSDLNTGINATSAGGGSVQVHANGAVSGLTTGINATTTGGTGSVLVQSGLSVSGSTFGINAQVLGNGTGNVTVDSSSGPVTTLDSSFGIRATTAGGGNITIETQNVTAGNASFGVNAGTFGGGNVTVDTHLGAVKVGNGSQGVNPFTEGGGNITVETANVTAGDASFGVDAGTFGGGNVTVDTHLGAVKVGNSSQGVNAFTEGGTGGDVAVTTANVTAGNASFGVHAGTFGGGNVTVDTHLGAVKVGNNSFGVNGFTSGGTGGDVAVTTANVTAGDASFGVDAATFSGGNVTVDTHLGAVIVGGNASTGINATARGAGNITIMTANVTGGDNGVAGVSAATFGGGDITVDTHLGTVKVGTNLSTAINLATGGGGNVTVATADVTAGNVSTGVNAQTFGGGNVTVDTHLGAVNVGTTSAGVNATTAGGSGGNVTVTTANVTAGNASTGVNAQTLAGGNVSIDTHLGAVTVGTNGAGINATTGGVTGGNITITTANVSAGGRAISAFAGGSGGVSIDTHLGAVSSASEQGIVASSNTGAVSVTTGSVTATTNNAINATSAGGNVTVQTNGPITANTTNTVGNTAIIAGGGTTGNVAVTTMGGSPVLGGVGINATTTSAGSVTINTFDTVQGKGTGGSGLASPPNGDAIFVSTAAGNVLVQNHNTVTGNMVAGGGDGIAVTSTTGNVTVNTFGAVSGDPAIIISTGGVISVDASMGPVTGTANGIQTTETGANSTTIVVQNGSPVSGGGVVAGTNGDGINARSAAGSISITTHDNVSGGSVALGNTGNGISTTTGATGTTNIVVADTGLTVTGTGAGKSGIFATGGGAAVTITTAAGSTVQGVGGTEATTANAITVAGSSAVNTVNIAGLAIGGATTLGATNAVVNITTTGATTVNVAGVVGTVTSDNPTAALRPGDAAIASAAGSGSVTINYSGGDLLANGLPQYGLIGRVTLAGGAGATDVVNLQGGGLWTVFGANTLTGGGGGNTIVNSGTININFQPGANPLLNTMLSGITPTTFTFSGSATDALTNNNLINSAGTVSFLDLANVNNNTTAVFNVGSHSGAVEITNFSTTGAVGTAFVPGTLAQTVTNTGTFNVFALQPTSVSGPYNGALNFYGGANSSFNNSGGVINMQADNGATTNAVTLNTASMSGTSDLNYKYTWSSTTPSYNFIGSGASGGTTTYGAVKVDTFFGGPGSTSDRLVIGGNISGTTQLYVNNINTGIGGFTPNGITVVAVQGTGSNNVVVAANGVQGPPGTAYVNTGPLGAVETGGGAFIYPLLYVPGGAPSTTGPNGNAYKFFGIPGPALVQGVAFPSMAENIFDATADVWYDRQEETRNCMRHGYAAAAGVYGGGADLAVKGAPPPPPPCQAGVWTKLIGSYGERSGRVDFGQLNSVLSGFGVDTSYRQTIGAALVGVDYPFVDLTGPYDSLVFSVMGGYVESKGTFNSPNSADSLPAPQNSQTTFTGGTVGVSATYINTGFFIDALFKADFLTMNVANLPGGICTQGNSICGPSAFSTTLGIIGNIGYRWEAGRYFIEPIGSVLWANNRIDNITLPSAQVTEQFGTNERIDVGGGLRAGGVIMDDRIHYLEGSFMGRVWDTVTGPNQVSFANIGPTFTLEDSLFNKLYGEAGFQLDWLNRLSGWSAYLRADAKFNDQFMIFTGKAGLRYGF